MEADWEELGRAESEAARELTRLLLPGEAVLALGLPTLPWDGAPPNAAQRALLLKLGVNEHPPLATLLEVAADASADGREGGRSGGRGTCAGTSPPRTPTTLPPTRRRSF